MATTDDATKEPAVESRIGAKSNPTPVGAPAPKPERVEPARPMPGLELLGRGIYLKPRQPYELKHRFAGQNPAELVGPQHSEREGLMQGVVGHEIYCVDAGKSYLLPDDFEVNHSPPMPANQTLNQTVIEQSWESLKSHFEVHANVAAGVGAFSVKANYSQINTLRSSEDAYYALRNSFIPAWTVDFTGKPNVDELRDSLKTLNHEIERPKMIEVLGEDGVWIYDLQPLLPKPTQEVAKTDLAELRDQIAKLLPAEVDETIPNPLTAECLDELRKDFVPPPEPSHENRVQFDRTRRELYEKFFQQYGTHFVKRVWVGGTATLAFAITKTTGTDMKKIQAGLNAGYGGAGTGATTDQKDSLETLKENSTCSVWGKGGDEPALAGLNSLDQENYNLWLRSVKANPQVIELEVVGIWSLVRDPHTNELEPDATALREAYRAIYEFEPIAAVFSPLSVPHVYFIKSALPQRVDNYDPLQKKMLQTWLTIEDRWPDLENHKFDRIDAAFSLPKDSLRLKSGEWGTRNVCFFRRDQYIWMDMSHTADAENKPAPIKEGFPGVTFDSIDAAVSAGPESIYFFSGDKYVRFNWTNNRADFKPRKFRDHWAGVTFDRIDAAIYWGNGKVYFFRGDRYIVYDMVTYRADPGYPEYLPGSYVGDWNIFD